MAYITFIVTMVLAAAAASLIDVDTTTSHADSPDYRLVPYAGDAFGA